MTFWALSFVWYKDAFLSYGPITVTLLRLLISVAFLFLIAFASGTTLKINAGDIKYIALVAFFEPFCYFIGEGYGMELVSPTTGAIIISTIPLLTPFVLALMKMKEKLYFHNYAGMVVSFAGILLVVASDGASFKASFKGVALLFLAVISAIFFSILLRKIGNKYRSVVIVFWQNVIAVFFFLPLFFAAELNGFLLSSHNPVSYFAILKLGILPSTISFILFIPVVNFLGAAKANMFTNLIPVITAVFSFFFFGEVFTIVKIIGISAVITGLFLSQAKYRNKKLIEVEYG